MGTSPIGDVLLFAEGGGALEVTTMKAVHLIEYGPPENLKFVKVPVPKPAENEVLIKVKSSSVIFAGILMRKGDYPALPASLPFVPGREVAGIVEQVGVNVTSIKPGMRVMGQMHTGGYAEYAKTSMDLAYEQEIREAMKVTGGSRDIAIVEGKMIKWGGCIIVDVSGGRIFDSTIERIYFRKSPAIHREVMRLLGNPPENVT
jgi:hypothetical protein